MHHTQRGASLPPLWSGDLIVVHKKMKISLLFILSVTILIFTLSCRVEKSQPNKADVSSVTAGMPWSVAESNIMTLGGVLTSMGWPSGVVYKVESETLLAIVGDQTQNPQVVTRIFVCRKPPMIVTEWPEVATFKLTNCTTNRSTIPTGALR